MKRNKAGDPMEPISWHLTGEMAFEPLWVFDIFGFGPNALVVQERGYLSALHDLSPQTRWRRATIGDLIRLSDSVRDNPPMNVRKTGPKPVFDEGGWKQEKNG